MKLFKGFADISLWLRTFERVMLGQIGFMVPTTDYRSVELRIHFMQLNGAYGAVKPLKLLQRNPPMFTREAVTVPLL